MKKIILMNSRYLFLVCIISLGLMLIIATGNDYNDNDDNLIIGNQNSVPYAYISEPDDRAIYGEGTEIIFFGYGSGLEDGTLTDSSFVWASSVDGQMGTGRVLVKSDLSIGTHTITLTTTDSNGTISTFSKTVIITVVTSIDILDDCIDIYLFGEYAYVANSYTGLQIIDISTPSSPSLAGLYDTEGISYGVYVSGNYAYVAKRLGDGGALRILDIGTPSSPSLAGSCDIEGLAFDGDVYVSGIYAYVAFGRGGLQIIDISTPSSPFLTGSYDTENFARGVYVSGNYAYVAFGSGGLQIIDISTPSSPFLTGSYDTEGYAYDVYVSDNYAYVTDLKGLQIIDISTPSSPSFTGSYDTENFARYVYVSDNYAYVATELLGTLQIIDISTPSSPSLAGSYDTEGSAYGVYVSGNYAYVTDRNSLHIIKWPFN